MDVGLGPVFVGAYAPYPRAIADTYTPGRSTGAGYFYEAHARTPPAHANMFPIKTYRTYAPPIDWTRGCAIVI